MITIEQLTKSYRSGKGRITALSNINLSIPKGEIFGIIGHSGAGKSTLVRCFNLLERPDSGRVILDGVELTALNKKMLMHERRKIGMIFQHFNLLTSQTVFNNIAFPLRLMKLDRKNIKRRVNELLALVGLKEHADKYPAQLSGGQKQRVGIARALANNPKVLLCDEATSALDPQTTQSILELLVEINRTLGLTIILITHEMEVIRSICHRVAIIHDSQIIESGAVEEIFLDPQHPVTRDFIIDQQQLSMIEAFHRETPSAHLYQVTYSGSGSFEPHLSKAISETGVELSILSGSIGAIRNLPFGQLIIAIKGSDEEKDKLLHYLSNQNIAMQPIAIPNSNHSTSY